MLQSTPLKSLSTNQRIAAGIVAVVALFLLIGMLTGPDGGSQPGFGLQTQSFLVLAILSFAGGVLSFVSPCTLPILPAYFAFAFQSGRKQIATNTMAFMLGLATMFSLLGAGASAIGRVLQQNADLLLLIGGGAVVIFGVMSLLGKGFTGFAQDDGAARNTSLGGSYAFGLTFAVGWTSCTGPILGVVLTLAATTGSVLRGVMLLFIYTLGLGLPLILVSTLFGRASRQSLFWRVLRGKGWEVTLPVLAVGVVWALAIWRILVAAANYLLSDFHTLTARPLTTLQEYGLLALALVGVALWIFTSSEERRTTLHLHSTQLISGALFILLGIFMLSGILSYFNSLIPPDLAIWFADIEEGLINFFNS